MKSVKFLMGVLAAIGMVACGGTELVGSKFVASEDVNALSGETIEVTQSELAGTRLEISPGALKNNMTITLEIGMTDVTKPIDRAGPVAVWGPAGIKFNNPIKMTLPYVLPVGKSTSDLSIAVKEADGSGFKVKNSDLTFNTVNKTVTFLVSGFTSFQPSTAPVSACFADRDCYVGESCVNNVCQSNDAGMGGGAGGGGMGGGAGGGGMGGGVGGGGMGGGAGGGMGGGNPSDGGMGGGSGGGTPTDGGMGGGGGGGGSFCRSDLECVLGEICISMTCVPGVSDGGMGGGSGGGGGGNPTDGGTGGMGGGGGTGGSGGGASDGGTPDGGTGGGGGGNPSDGGMGGGGGGSSDGGSGGGGGGGGATDGGSGLNCSSSLDCPMPEVCNANRCVAISCIPAVPCPGQFTCTNGWCL